MNRRFRLHSGPRSGAGDNLLAAALMVASMAAFVFNDTAIKLVTQTLPLSEGIALRGIAVTAILWVIAQRDGGVVWWPKGRRDRLMLSLRTVAEVSSTLVYLLALQLMSLGQLSAVMQATPLLIMLAAAVVFRERLGWRRLSAVGVGLAGVLLILRPGTGAFDASALLAVVAVVLIVVRDLASRGFTPAVRSSTVAFYAALAVTLGAPLTGELGDWRWPTGGEVMGLAVSTVFLTIGYLTAVAVMRVGEVGFVSPFRYSALIFAFLVDLAVFGVWPAGWTWVGAGLVVAAGLYSIWREARLQDRSR
ncbi:MULTISPECIES: DMT family transporter [unclassified Paracoccus (in: a-proteobacteria)]|uniref:DMT family transporter n=1 Tax=unclassified Paracoccus (in: a-proteobacteria) TaxID=2688777 RepID=UPI001F42C230|nr:MULTISPECIES: DMT family transporter [unclassified Paracoccus (in: a-proteobacteria)]